MEENYYKTALKIALDTLKEISTEANGIQGDWGMVTMSAAPQWTHNLKKLEGMADRALSQIEELSAFDFTQPTRPSSRIDPLERGILLKAFHNNGGMVMDGAIPPQATMLVERGLFHTLHETTDLLIVVLTEEGRIAAEKLE
jgi:hypothetical protein